MADAVIAAHADFKALFQATPTQTLVLARDAPRFTIVAVTDAYLRLTHTRRERLIGQSLGEVLADDPKDPDATRIVHLRASLERVVSSRAPELMPEQHFAVRTPAGVLETRLCRFRNLPVLDETGALQYILHEVEEVSPAERHRSDGGVPAAARAEPVLALETNERIVQHVVKDSSGAVLVRAENLQDNTERTAAEQQLRASESRFRGTFDNAAVGIAHVSLNGRWLRVNDKLCAIMDYTREELLECTFQDITHPEDLNADLTLVARVLVGEIQTYSMEKRYLRRDNSIVWINLTVSLMKKETGEPDYFISIIEDIGARKQVSMALKESEARLAALADNMSQLAWMADDTGARTWFNRSWLAYTGKSRADVLGWRWTKVHPTHALLEDKYRSRIARGRSWTETHDILDASGKPRSFLTQVVPIRDESAHIIGWVGTHTDVTAERETQRAHERARFFELSLDMVCITTRSGEFVHLSTEFSTILGYSVEELLHRQLFDLVHPDEVEDVRRELQRLALATGTRAFTKRFRCQDHSYRWLQWRLAPTPDGMLYAIARDVTSDRELVESLQRAERELRAHQSSLTASLREREVLLQEIHHRVKNNLQVISSLISMQVRRLQEPLVRSALEECRCRVEAIALIHEQLYQSNDYRQIPFAQYLGGLLRYIAEASGLVSQQVTVSVEPRELALPVDKAIPCGLILNELVTNAFKHAFPQGRRGEVRVSLHARAGELEIRVADNGVGLSTRCDVTSPSLGMQLVQTLVEQLNGRMTMTQSSGTIFTIVCRLPAETTSDAPTS